MKDSFRNEMKPTQTIKSTLGIFAILLFAACGGSGSTMSGTKVTNQDELNKAIKEAKPGDNIIMANGVWKDTEIKFVANGEEGKLITLQAETMGEVTLEGQSCLKLGGQYLVVKGLHFKNGYTPSKAVINFKKDEETFANHCRVTECVIENYNQPRRDKKDHWIELWGRHNEIDHCYIAGKSNDGPTLRVFLKGNQHIKNFHKVTNNHFGPRPRKGGPRGETMQIGDSYTSMSPCNMMIADNLFEECNGEVEVISSKTNFNEFRGNVFYKSEGSLVTRHGSYCTIDGNFFIGDGSENVGGIRLINSGHWVTNNYFYNLKGKQFRSPLAMMNGIPKSPLNRYLQVTDAVVAYNTYINCESPWHFGVGSNVSEAAVLPKSEIRSARPDRVVVANNLIYSEKGDPNPIMTHDSIDGITFKSNVISNNGVGHRAIDGLYDTEFSVTEMGDYVYAVDGSIDTVPYAGFDFETIITDIFGNERVDNNQVGAIIQAGDKAKSLLDKSRYGASWFSNVVEKVEGKIHNVHPVKDHMTADNSINSGELLSTAISQSKSGDTILLADGEYTIPNSLVINKTLTIRGSKTCFLVYNGAANTPLFEMNPKGDLTIEGTIMRGNNKNYAFATLKENMSSHYNLEVQNCNISGFNYVLKGYKESMAQEITFSDCYLENCANGIELSEETNDRGDYNVEFLTIDNCTFKNVKSNVIDYYRGGYDESTIGGNLNLTNSTFTNCGVGEANGILINHRGIIHVNIHDNEFTNNKVKRISILWGAKDNHESGNKINNSGRIEIQQNLALKLMY